MPTRRALLCVVAVSHLHGILALQTASQPAVRPLLKRQRPSVIAAAEAASDEGQAGLPSSTANLVKSIVGSGVLSLPVGLAAFSSSRAALVPSLALTPKLVWLCLAGEPLSARRHDVDG